MASGALGAVDAATEAVSLRLAGLRPTVGIVLGSGAGPLADDVEDGIRIPYREIPGFPEAGVTGHRGELVGGTLADVPVLVQSGRFHFYEGHAADVVALPVRIFARLGVHTLVLTNAAGGIRPTFRPGTLMLISDHINLMWRYPLAGPVVAGEERFPDMSDPYDAGLRRLAHGAARTSRVPLEEGVYAALLGPQYETPAEIRMLQRIGADAVGMSTVPEVIVARARGVRCLGISTITNVAAGLAGPAPAHDEVLQVGRTVAAQLGALIRGVLRQL